MTRYEQGFMNKCAEYGLDPGEVARYAMQKRAGVWNGMRRLGSRFWELLRGGNKNVLKDYTATRNAAKNWIDSGIKYRNNSARNVGDIILDQLAAARGGAGSKVRVNFNGTPRHIYDIPKIMNPAVNNELDKVLAARVGTGIAGLGAAGALYGSAQS